MEGAKTVDGAFYIKETIACPGKLLPELRDKIKQELLALNWVTKRTARHEYFMSDTQLTYSYGNKGEEAELQAKRAAWYEANMHNGMTPDERTEAAKLQFPASVYTSKPFSPSVRRMMDNLNELYGTDFTACFLNKYDDQHQHLGWHADEFEGMRGDQPIAIVSLGAEREIWVKSKRGFKCDLCKGLGKFEDGIKCYPCAGSGWRPGPPNARQPDDQRIKLEEGSLFIMPPGYQSTHLHRIPKHDRPCGWRISLTFRSFV